MVIETRDRTRAAKFTKHGLAYLRDESACAVQRRPARAEAAAGSLGSDVVARYLLKNSLRIEGERFLLEALTANSTQTCPCARFANPTSLSRATRHRRLIERAHEFGDCRVEDRSDVKVAIITTH